ncbi:hypothetical protein H634G_11230 [Metarhizium anisopliae BRIP 53293]|uniref:Uncharacterized protein n=1 Tax=Metarhizium anisopliae BRIP 53293 TaxID=1291518 RepID=A0A0D9NLQ3_METAN|nr:hypothetical protein H634G_11230 [Metarhizium anisopliae BRIP 53293]KJK85027.1 hypothetical protein H633G_11141 [Metarhizium anisopliae BRIP 53284]
MSSAHSNRGNAPALGRLWDLIRRKRGVDRHAPYIRELLREERGDIVKELERILESQRALDSLTSPSELHVAVAYLSASTQTEAAEKPATPIDRPRLGDAARQTPNYTSSSTQVDLDVAEERASAVISQAAIVSLGSTSCIQSSDTAGIRKTRSREPLSSQILSTSPPRLTAVVRHHQRYLIDSEAGAIYFWKMSKVPWRGKAIPVCLPPRYFRDPGPQDSSRTMSRFPSSSEKHIGKMELVRQRLQAWADEGIWITADDMKWFTDVMEECMTDGREWLKAYDTEEDMTRETTANEDDEDNWTDVESSMGSTTAFNPDLYKGVKFF